MTEDIPQYLHALNPLQSTEVGSLCHASLHNLCTWMESSNGLDVQYVK